MVAFQPPTLTPDQARILEAFIASGFDPVATATAAGLSLSGLLAWHRHPAVQAVLDDLEALQARAADLQLAAARRDATRALHAILRDPDSDPAERRRAATALMRPSPRPRATGSKHQPHTHAPGPADRPSSRTAHDEDLAVSRALATLNAAIDALEAEPSTHGAAGPALTDRADQRRSIPKFASDHGQARARTPSPLPATPDASFPTPHSVTPAPRAVPTTPRPPPGA